MVGKNIGESQDGPSKSPWAKFSADAPRETRAPRALQGHRGRRWMENIRWMGGSTTAEIVGYQCGTLW